MSNVIESIGAAIAHLEQEQAELNKKLEALRAMLRNAQALGLDVTGTPPTTISKKAVAVGWQEMLVDMFGDGGEHSTREMYERIEARGVKRPKAQYLNNFLSKKVADGTIENVGRGRYKAKR